MARQHQLKPKSNKLGRGKSISPESAPIQRAAPHPTSQNLTPEAMRSLQTTHGNQYVMRLAQSSLMVQPKLTVTPAAIAMNKRPIESRTKW